MYSFEPHMWVVSPHNSLFVLAHLGIMFITRKTDFSRAQLWAAQMLFRVICLGIMALARYTD